MNPDCLTPQLLEARSLRLPRGISTGLACEPKVCLLTLAVDDGHLSGWTDIKREAQMKTTLGFLGVHAGDLLMTHARLFVHVPFAVVTLTSVL